MLAAGCLLLSAGPAEAQRVHEVHAGQTISHIAHHYDVSVAAILGANGLKRGSILRPGELLTVPERGVIYVHRGGTLYGIAHDHGIGVNELARANHLKPDATLQEGQRLVLPGFEAAENAKKAAQRWGRSKHPGTLTLVRVANRHHLRIHPLDSRGRLRRAAAERISRLMDDRVTHERHRMHPTLLRLLVRISDHFGGRPIYVVSGYRDAQAHQYTSRESRHTEGRAVDFHIGGVPNEVLRDYCRHLGHVGVGFYPHSTFVHLDVRKKPAYWVDWSRPGQQPIYQRPGEPPPQDEQEAVASNPNDNAPDAGEGQAASKPPEPQGDTGEPAPSTAHAAAPSDAPDADQGAVPGA